MDASSELRPLPRRVHVRDIDGRARNGRIEAEATVVQSDSPNKVGVMQRIEWDDGRLEVRTGYYIRGKKPGARGRMVWGQYALMLPFGDFLELLKRAIVAGVLTNVRTTYG